MKSLRESLKGTSEAETPADAVGSEAEAEGVDSGEGASSCPEARLHACCAIQISVALVGTVFNFALYQ